MASVDTEKLLVELQDKEHKLMRAAGYGKELLEENERLKLDLYALQLDCTRLEEALQKLLDEAKKKVAEKHISELEEELDSCRSNLKLERAFANSAREERKRLTMENEELKQHLTQVKEKLTTEIQQLKKRLQECETLKKTISGDYNNAKRSLQQLQEENQTIGKDLSFMYRSNKKLSTELEDTKDAAGFWENQYHSQEEMCQSQSKELDDFKHLQKQLILELDQKYLPEIVVSVARHASTSSSISLYAELSQADDVEQGGGNPGDTTYPYMSDDEKFLTLRPKHTVCEATSSSCQMEETTAQSEETGRSTCQRCQELEAHHKEQEVELKTLNELLLLAAQQKFKLQQQIDSWECDMAEVLGSQINHKLSAEKEQLLAEHKKMLEAEGCDFFKGRSLPRRLALRFRIIKNYWLF